MPDDSQLKLGYAVPLSDVRYLVAIIAGFWLLWDIYSRVSAYRRLRHIPGPKIAAWTNLWWLSKAASRKGHIHLYEACQQYGNLVRIAPNVLVTGDIELMRRMHAVRSPYRRSDWNKAFRFDADREHVFSETDYEKHLQLRAKLSLGYSGKENSTLESDMDEVILTMTDLISTKYISCRGRNCPVDMGQILQYVTLDIITALSLGKPIGWLEDEDKYQYVATMQANLPTMNLMSALPLTRKILATPWVQRLILPSVKDRIGLGKIKAIIHDIIAGRVADAAAGKPRRNDMTQSFIDHGLTAGELMDNAVFQIMAASDTSGTVMRAFMVFVTAAPRIYRKLQEEVTRAEVPLNRVIPYVDAGRLPYLTACIRETLRYYPVSTGLMPKLVGPDGDNYKGLYLPPGTEIGTCAWMLYRHNPSYNADCGVFRPERWLDSTPEQLARMEKDHEMVFSHGRFKCLGERIARMELYKTLFELFRRFDLSLLNPMQPLEKNDNYSLWCMRRLMMRAELLDRPLEEH